MSNGGPRPDQGRRKRHHYIVDGRKYNSIEEAATGEGVVVSTISKWCNGRRDGCYIETLFGKKIKPKHPAPKAPKKPKHDATHEPPKTETQESIPNRSSGLDGDSTRAEINDAAKAANMTPLDFFLSIMRDVDEEKELRIKVAYYAAPYVHPKGVEKKGKKEEREEKAEKVALEKYPTGKPPRLKVVSK